MELLISYKCNCCGKLYVNSETCCRHELRCYNNPDTRSCKSCSYLQKVEYTTLTRKLEILPTCVKNQKIYKRLKTKCVLHHWKELADSTEVVAIAKRTFYTSPRIRYYGKNYSWWRLMRQYVLGYFGYRFKS